MFRVAVVVPCHNEEVSVGRVVEDFRAALPDAVVVVADNASTDATAQRARDAGAVVLSEPRRGKGVALRRLFADVDADCYLMVDGDCTYDAGAARALIQQVSEEGADMVVAVRISAAAEGAERAEYRRGHRFGNRVLSAMFSRLFGLALTDTLSGYRALSRRFVKSFPATPQGFEVEAELNAHAAALGARTVELPSNYYPRPEGSFSNLSTYRDGLCIFRRNLRLFRDASPILAFACLALPWLVMSIVLTGIPLTQYFSTGQVLRFPSLIVGVGSFLVSLNLIVAGIVLARVARNRVETTRLAYLAQPSPVRVPAAQPLAVG